MFADLSRVVIEGSRGLGKRVERQDDGLRTDFLKLGLGCELLLVGLMTSTSADAA